MSSSVSSSTERKTRFGARRQHEKIKISVSYPSADNLPSPTVSTNSSVQMSMCTSNGKDLNHLENQPNLFKEDFPNRSRDFSPVTTRRLGKRNIKVQVRKFRMETKAAKTLAIIVGGFIVCWLPFFTIYLYRGFCDGCVNDLLFSVLFWLGYCNSAVNPLVYALFSKDFRLAFKRIIWKCFCSTKYLKSEHKLRTTKLSPCLTPDVTPRSDTDLSVTR